MEPNRMRKIEVQSPDDIRFLFENLSRAAREKIDLHLPPGAADRDDGLRKRVEEMVLEYVCRTFEFARHSIAVNGLDAGPISTYLQKDDSEGFEPYDRKLHDQVLSLHSEIEHETLKVAQLRREAPARVAQTYEEQLKREVDSDERILAEMTKKAKAKAGPENAGDLGIRPLERAEEIAKGYQKSVEMLKELQSILPATAHKLTRAQDALDYVGSKG